MAEENNNEKGIIIAPFTQIFAKQYIDYAMDVICDRALADVRDGLKPVHRRILYGLLGLGLLPSKSYRKSARVVGEVLGKYHPHGDSSVYDALIILAQEFATRYPLVDVHGNVGSIDGDSAAAMRYTEARLAPCGYLMLQDINKDIIDFKDNYDGHEKEPVVLGSLFPNLLANGSFGIAVGMASNIPSHNLHDIYSACYYIIDKTMKDEEPDIEEVIRRIKAPDFATGGTIIGLKGVKEGYRTGNGKFAVRSKYEITDDNKIIITEIPYKVNKEKMVEEIRQNSVKHVDKNKKEVPALFPEIKSITDETDRDGIRIVIETKKDANVQILLNNLIKKSKFQVNYSINSIALVDGVPKTLTLLDILENFLSHATNVIIRRTEHDLKKAQKRLHVLGAILKCCEDDPDAPDRMFLDRVIDTIRFSEDPSIALMNLGFDEMQADYLLETKLRKISNSSLEETLNERESLSADIERYNKIINEPEVLLSELESEFHAIEDKYADDRRTEIQEQEENIEDIDLVKDETLVITYTSDNVIKAVEEKEYKKQNRGGKGVKATNTKNDEYIKFMFTANSKDDLLFFTNLGRCYCLKVFKIGKASKFAKGKSINNYLSLNEGEKIVNVICANIDDKDNNLFFVTKQGYVKKLSLEQLSSRSASTRVIGFKNEEDMLVKAMLVKNENVIISTSNGLSARIDSSKVRAMGRSASGVIGIELLEDTEVVDMDIVKENGLILTITKNGFGKKTEEKEWRLMGRGCKGIKCHNITEKTGNLIATLSPDTGDELFIATKQGLITRISADAISTCGRSAAGVKLINLNSGDSVASVSLNAQENPDEEEIES